ncbi:MAG: D-tyrosyl-tRNA(Tyr) deacylase [Actinobacteria bacterium]|nr:D-tyrosyl-tRNA(Tyr) deacylase [Actinomycetota bacterium]
MRAVLQRVTRAHVSVDGSIVGAIGGGILALVGVADGDRDADATWLAQKIAELRIFRDEHRPMNRSIEEDGGAVLVVSQFTLLADTRRGRRPGFTGAARPEVAEPLCRRVAELLRARGLHVEEGRFGAMMDVELVGDGPVTIVLDSRNP